MWDPSKYLRFGAERSRPFFELVGRIGATRSCGSWRTWAAGLAS